ncbi:MAG: hypothetical protein PHT64_00200 [Bacteroidales bacterium]|nr:hypothetical protein [Bacteroidales bacterium]MDD5732202.1 hypothetical protein [Bacteroidales bacterium]
MRPSGDHQATTGRAVDDHRAVVLAVKRINVKVAASARKGKPRQKEKASLSLWRQRLPVQAAEAPAKMTGLKATDFATRLPKKKDWPVGQSFSCKV